MSGVLHWVLVVMDQFIGRIIGFGVQVNDVDGQALCRMFNTAISKQGDPTYLSSDNDPLFQYHQWQANLRILELQDTKTGSLYSSLTSIYREADWQRTP